MGGRATNPFVTGYLGRPVGRRKMNSTDATTGISSGEFSEELKPGTPLLQGQYVIERYLNSGGFGMTYLARDSLDRIVVIKECFPASFCARKDTYVGARSRSHQKDFKAIVKLFVQEARRLSKMKHPNIVGVHQVFEDNDTAYMALDYIKGQDLFDILDEGKIQLSPTDIRLMLLKILSAVGYIHDQDVLHRDISPDNILLEKSGNPILIDFGAAREKATKASRALTSMHIVKDGYSPQEFYIADAVQSPASDLYALAATFYHVIVGKAPPNSQARLACIAADKDDPYISILTLTKDYDRSFLTAIDKALNVFADDRVQSAREWITAIDIEKRRAHALALAKRDQKIDQSISKLVSETNQVVFEEIKRDEREKKDVVEVIKEKKKPPIVLLSPIFVVEDKEKAAEPENAADQRESDESLTNCNDDASEETEAETDPAAEVKPTQPRTRSIKRTSKNLLFWRARQRSQQKFRSVGKSQDDDFRKAGL